MTQFELESTLQRLRRQAERESTPLVTPGEQAEWDRRKQAALAIVAAAVTALIENRISIAEFERIMTAAIRESHALAYAVARGGALTPADELLIRQRSDRQLLYLAAWIASLAAAAGGGILLRGNPTTEAMQAARAAMYIEEAGGSLFAGKAAAVGLPTLPAYPKDGSTRCLKNCYCGWNIKDLGGGDWDCYWMLNWTGLPETHCEHCPRRALAWSPLQVRGGVIQPYWTVGLFL